MAPWADEEVVGPWVKVGYSHSAAVCISQPRTPRVRGVGVEELESRSSRETVSRTKTK